MKVKEYKKDLLSCRFEERKIPLDNDYEGIAIATLIRHLPEKISGKAILYIHGFNDYFFQKEMAYQLNRNGVNFYALDLRKYGRSYLPHQKFNDIRNLKAYFEEISKALAIIHSEGNSKITIMGHSTGGLIVTLFAKYYTDKKLFDGIILNSPFFEFNVKPFQKIMIPIASLLGKYMPRLKISGGFSENYGKSIHRDFSGEWEYDLNLKPNMAPKVNLGWIRAIHKAHNEFKKNLHIKEPILILRSSRSVTDPDDIQQLQSMDAILDVKQIERISLNIQGDKESYAIEGGLHDLVLSKKDVREKVYQIIRDWMDRKKLS